MEAHFRQCDGGTYLKMMTLYLKIIIYALLV